MSLSTLHPAHRFMYEYGCFTAFWSNFELTIEVGVWLLSGKSPKENCRIVNFETAGKKRRMLEKLLLAAGNSEAKNALDEVFEVADRNGWIHGHVLNPNGDFSRLTRLRVTAKPAGLLFENRPVSFDASPFETFYKAFGKFEAASGITKEKCNEYITLLQAP